MNGSTVELRVLGTPSLRGPDGTELHSVLARPRLLALLVALASAPASGFLRRDSLLGLFWPDMDQERARASLRQALYNLRQSLGTAALETRGEEEVRLDPGVVWADVAAFRTALATGDTAAGLELYRGDLLAGFFLPRAPEFELWLDRTRRTLREEAAEGAWRLAETALGEENAGGVGHWTRRALSLAPLDEILLRKGMEFLAGAGDRAGAAHVYAAFARRSEEELGLHPAEETRALFERIATVDPMLAAETRELPSPEAPESLPTGDGAPSGLRRGRLPALVIAGAVIVFLVLAWISRGQERTGPGLARRPPPDLAADSLSPAVLAVLPFQAHGSEEGTEELAAGVHEEILTYLSQVAGLRVISRRSVEQYARTDLTLQEIAARLGAGSVLEGSVQKEGPRVRISIQLIDALTDTHLWAQTYYREPRDLLEAQVEIALRVAGTLRANLLYGQESGPVHDSLVEALSQDLMREILQARPEGPVDPGR